MPKNTKTNSRLPSHPIVINQFPNPIVAPRCSRLKNNIKQQRVRIGRLCERQLVDGVFRVLLHLESPLYQGSVHEYRTSVKV
jgi:hypothetical protein